MKDLELCGEGTGMLPCGRKSYIVVGGETDKGLTYWSHFLRNSLF